VPRSSTVAATLEGDGSPDLTRRAKQVLRATTGHDVSAPAAIAAELEAQQWSVEQPFFAETLKAVRARIGSR
jgi:hypothetical protein